MSLQDTFKYTLTNNIFIETALQNIPGFDVQRKFFENPDLKSGVTAELWDYGGTEEVYAQTVEAGADYYLFSDDNSDTQLTHVTIQDEDGYEYVVAVQMAGNTPVKVNDLANDFLSYNQRITAYKCTRCYRFENKGTTSYAGSVYITEGNDVTTGVPNDTLDVRAFVNNGNNKTLMCQYRIPTGFVGLFYWTFVSVTRKIATIAELSIWVTQQGSVEVIEDKMSINTVGTTTLERVLPIPQIIPTRSDITMKANTDADCGLSGSYVLLLVKEEFADRAIAALEAGAHIV